MTKRNPLVQIRREEKARRASELLTQGLKMCCRCQKEKSVKLFHLNKKQKDGYHVACKDCRRKNETTIYSRDVAKKSWLKRAYKVTPEEYEAMLKAQNGVCAACGHIEKKRDPRSGVLRTLCIDHDHKTGKIRALLCDDCNSSFGRMREDPKRIRGLLAYAEKWV